MKLPLDQLLIPQFNFLIPLYPMQEISWYLSHNQDTPFSLVSDGINLYLSMPWQFTMDHLKTTVLFPLVIPIDKAKLYSKDYLQDFIKSCPYVLVTKHYYKDKYPCKCWKIPTQLINNLPFSEE